MSYIIISKLKCTVYYQNIPYFSTLNYVTSIRKSKYPDIFRPETIHCCKLVSSLLLM